MVVDVGLIGHPRWEGGGRIADAEGRGFSKKGRPLLLRGIGAVDDGFAEGVVACDVLRPRWRPERLEDI